MDQTRTRRESSSPLIAATRTQLCLANAGSTFTVSGEIGPYRNSRADEDLSQVVDKDVVTPRKPLLIGEYNISVIFYD